MQREKNLTDVTSQNFPEWTGAFGNCGQVLHGCRQLVL